jgi:hypothetical protein
MSIWHYLSMPFIGNSKDFLGATLKKLKTAKFFDLTPTSQVSKFFAPLR